ncbi:uncharacterized protein P174DRAFT_61424 [Aspergillus novofumigatus IBT 16806]|uniref:Uncharacterized protein n=1 Tax=Aspergillus novofumigatus (strain IBT 16806) TaxID=1392255 RepID=A0A2I1BUH4_ASPN1|nr:uncharacterized protein P174DRAFT_61424 [Aspergillus novofumigatus IBT 16806]PKX89004.1 hypothetical protein P174DRAFT_61424 [Aspergillus novofumigatus IBT 16806]
MSQLLVKWLGEALELAQVKSARTPRAGKLVKPGHLESVEKCNKLVLWSQVRLCTPDHSTPCISLLYLCHV